MQWEDGQVRAWLPSVLSVDSNNVCPHSGLHQSPRLGLLSSWRSRGLDTRTRDKAQSGLKIWSPVSLCPLARRTGLGSGGGCSVLLVWLTWRVPTEQPAWESVCCFPWWGPLSPFQHRELNHRYYSGKKDIDFIQDPVPHSFFFFLIFPTFI